MTRPEPTIYGNCDSWRFIVGKKAVAQSPYKSLAPSLRPCHTELIHNLSTESARKQQNNLWVSCGALGGKSWESRMVVICRLFISISIFIVDSLDDFIIKEGGLTQIGKIEIYFQIVGRIRQTTSRVNPLFSKGLARPNHGVLGPLSPTQQYIDGLVFVQACEQLGKSFDIGHLGVGDLHDYVTLSDTSF